MGMVEQGTMLATVWEWWIQTRCLLQYGNGGSRHDACYSMGMVDPDTMLATVWEWWIQARCLLQYGNGGSRHNACYSMGMVDPGTMEAIHKREEVMFMQTPHFITAICDIYKISV